MRAASEINRNNRITRTNQHSVGRTRTYNYHVIVIAIGGSPRVLSEGRCSRTCGGGYESRQRTCSPPQHGVNHCMGESGERRSCNTQACPTKQSSKGSLGAYPGTATYLFQSLLLDVWLIKWAKPYLIVLILEIKPCLKKTISHEKICGFILFVYQYCN